MPGYNVFLSSLPINNESRIIHNKMRLRIMHIQANANEQTERILNNLSGIAACTCGRAHKRRLCVNA